jgi:hypothetical protein
MLSSDGVISQIRFTMATDSGISTMRQRRDIEIFEDSVFAAGSGRIAMFSREECQATLFGDGRVIFSAQLFAESELINCCQDRILYCSDPYTISIVSERNKWILCQCLSRILKFIVSQEFKIVVVATIDGNLHVFDLRTGKLVRTVLLDSEIERLLITPKWGFILAKCETGLTIVNVNGSVVLKLDKFEKIEQWWSFCSGKGFDYVVFVCEGRIGFFEALVPESISWFFDVKDAVAFIGYDFESESFVVVSTGGEINGIPYPPLE